MFCCRKYLSCWRHNCKVILCILFSIIITIPNVYAQESKPINFDIWKEGLKSEAMALGVDGDMFDSIMSDAKYIQRIIDLDRKQPERTITFKEYRKRVVSATRIRKGRRLKNDYIDTLNNVESKFGVQKRFIVALWGIETDYGSNTGGFYVPSALATLAYEGRRKEFFKKELLNSLRIVNDKHIKKEDMIGSWAGAMGQSQFMPSSFFEYAVDYDGDGKKDIWKSRYDVFGSIANYLAQIGWNNEGTWGRRIKLPEKFDIELADIKISKQIDEWQKLGVRRVDGRDLPKNKIKASLIMPNKDKNNAFLVYGNYKKILKWNRSHYFALSVGLLSDALNK